MDSGFILISSDSDDSDKYNPSQEVCENKDDSPDVLATETDTQFNQPVGVYDSKRTHRVRVTHNLSSSNSSDQDEQLNSNASCKIAIKNFHNVSDSPGSDDSENGYSCESQNNSQSPAKKKLTVNRKHLTAEERAILKGQKDREKAEKIAAKEKLRQLKPGECMKFVKVVLDMNIVSGKYFPFIEAALKDFNVSSTIQTQKVPNSITWIRQIPDTNEISINSEPVAIIIWHYKEFLNHVERRSLHDTIRQIERELPNKNITLVICGLGYQLRHEITNKRKSRDGGKSKQNKNKEKIDRKQIEMELVKLQFELNCNYRIIDPPQEVGMLVAQFTKSIAETPFKKEKERKEQEMAWLASADSRDCVRVDKAGNGLKQLWQQQLTQFNNCSLAIVCAIVSHYPTPQALVNAYKSCSSVREAETLLKNIPIMRATAPNLAAVRRIGPELSKKLFLFFTSKDTHMALNQ